MYDAVEWNDDEELFEKWCQGQTGFPIVDAGMRELVTTGFMHNRVRMIVASFLVKDLHISWQKGEAFFAQHLTDYDPAVNNGSWQWAASTGCDAQPYFRIFNPWLQQKRFDPDCVYIKKWLPELRQLSSKYIHTMNEEDITRSVKYPRPIVEHSRQKIHAEEMFRACQK
jgi:deoxyribodipyrimidine photo-lyase